MLPPRSSGWPALGLFDINPLSPLPPRSVLLSKWFWLCFFQEFSLRSLPLFSTPSVFLFLTNNRFSPLLVHPVSGLSTPILIFPLGYPNNVFFCSSVTLTPICGNVTPGYYAPLWLKPGRSVFPLTPARSLHCSPFFPSR